MANSRNYTASEARMMDKIRRENSICYYCGKGVTKDKRTVDHKVPYSRGGKTTEDNLVMCCDKCNSLKAMLTEPEYNEFLAIVNEKIKNSITIKCLNDLVNTHKEIMQRSQLIRSQLNDKRKEKEELERIIMNCTMSASDGYMLCRDLKSILLDIDALDDEDREIQSVLSTLGQSMKENEIKINSAKEKIMIKYRTKYIENLKIV